MIKCDFCVASWYDDNGKVHSYNSWCTANNCAAAIKTMSEVMKEKYRSKNSKNINKNYNYNKRNSR